jgi:hypothetical protein
VCHLGYPAILYFAINGKAALSGHRIVFQKVPDKIVTKKRMRTAKMALFS